MSGNFSSNKHTTRSCVLTHLRVAQLGDNNFVSYLITEEDEEAEKFLEEAKRSFGKGLKKDRSRGDCLKILVNCKQSRKVSPPCFLGEHECAISRQAGLDQVSVSYQHIKSGMWLGPARLLIPHTIRLGSRPVVPVGVWCSQHGRTLLLSMDRIRAYPEYRIRTVQSGAARHGRLAPSHTRHSWSVLFDSTRKPHRGEWS